MQYALDKMMKNPYKYMSSFNWKKTMKTLLRKAPNVMLLKASLGAMDNMKRCGGICGGC